MNKSDTISKVMAKIDAISREVGYMQKKETNPFFKNKYVTLLEIQNVLREPCEKHKIGVSQPLYGQGIMTIVSDEESGEWVGFESNINSAHLKPQDQMAGVTYMKRYGLTGTFNIATGDKDDDGNSTQGGNTKEAKGGTVIEDDLF